MEQNIWFKLLKAFLRYRKKIEDINILITNNENFTKGKKIVRNPNFPSELSENLVIYCWHMLYSIKFDWKSRADLWKKTMRYEVKASCGIGPISFSTKINYAEIFFIDASDAILGNYILYHVKCDAKIFQEYKANLTRTFQSFNGTKSRPRCSLQFLLDQWRIDKQTEIDFYKIEVDMKKKEISINKMYFPL